MKFDGMNNFHEAKTRWASALREPWKDTRLVGKVKHASEEVSKLLRQSISLQSDGRGGECISALLIGPNGSGKTLAVRSAISELEAEGNQVISITLHGSNCSDDKSSMKQIFSQFQKYLIGSENSDILSKVNFRTGTLSEWCERLQRLLEECSRSDHMVVITLEDFEAFCHSKGKQSLLYNLFDLMHVKEARFVVIGVTSRPDVSELLEKRIKSRFQLRKILVVSPDTVDEIVDVVSTVLIPPNLGVVKVKAPRGRKAGMKSKDEFSYISAIQQTLESKELRQQWSFYKDLGYSLRDFAIASLSAVLSADSVESVHEAIQNAMPKMVETTPGDVCVMKTMMDSLTQRDHIVLIGLLKLHQYGKRPKCFMNILKEIGSFEKRGACSQICKHSKRAYWHAFCGLVRLGLIETIEFGGISAALAPPPMFARCRLTIAESYRLLFLQGATSKGQLSLLPAEVVQWACQTSDVSDVM
jgi:hypothetical protein